MTKKEQVRTELPADSLGLAKICFMSPWKLLDKLGKYPVYPVCCISKIPFLKKIMPAKHPAHESRAHENTVASAISKPNLPSHDNKVLLKHPTSSKAPNEVLIAGSDGSLKRMPFQRRTSPSTLKQTKYIYGAHQTGFELIILICHALC